MSSEFQPFQKSPSKDHYARADCAKKFFFTIELCEIIRLDRIEIASYELFSSRAKDFKISAADAEKLRWMDLGNFQAAKFTQKNNLQVSRTERFQLMRIICRHFQLATSLVKFM